MSYLFVAVLVLLQVADYWTSRVAFASGGTEINPIVRAAQRAWGEETGLAVAKAVVAVLLIVAAVAGASLWWWPWTMAALIVFYAAVIAHNVSVIRSLSN